MSARLQIKGRRGRELHGHEAVRSIIGNIEGGVRDAALV